MATDIATLAASLGGAADYTNTNANPIFILASVAMDRLSLRKGQAMFLALNHYRPDLAAQIHASPLDPFYSMDRAVVKEFVEWVWAQHTGDTNVS